MFDPDWVVAPSAMLREHMEDNDLDILDLCQLTGLTMSDLDPVIMGVAGSLTLDIAEALAVATRISATMWLAMEDTYVKGVAAGKKVST